MKHLLTKLSTAIILSIAFILPTQAMPETYTLDDTHTAVIFHISHFGFSNPSGKWMANGTLTLDEEKPQNSTLKATINVADVLTGIPKLDEHLKSEDFFDTKKYPTAIFSSDKIEITSKNTAKVYGTLTLHGISKPIILAVKLNKLDINPLTKKKTAGFTASTTLKRSDFGIHQYIPNLSDEVKIDIEAEANHAD